MSRYHLGFFSWKLSPSRRDIMSCHYRIRHIKTNSADISSKSAWLATLRFHAKFWDLFYNLYGTLCKQGCFFSRCFFGCLRSCTISNHKAGSRKSTQQLKCNKLIMHLRNAISCNSFSMIFNSFSSNSSSEQQAKQEIRIGTPLMRLIKNNHTWATFNRDGTFLMQIFGTRKE